MSEKSPVIKLKAKERGQGLVEFALILPLFLLLVWGIIEFGRLLVMYTEVSNAAREAVRYGVARGLPGEGMQRYLNCDQIIEYGRAVTAMVGLQAGDFEIGYDRGDGVVYSHCVPEPGEQWPPDVRLGDRMVVTVTHEIRPLVLFQDAGPFRMQFTTARTIVHAGMPMQRVGDEVGITEAPYLEFIPDDLASCSGWFTWTQVTDAELYVLYQTVPIEERRTVGSSLELRYPPEGWDPNTITVRNDQEYRVLGTAVSGDGPLSNIEVITGCMEVLPAPDPFNFVMDSVSPCSGTFSWGAVDGEGYRLYEDGVQINGDIAATSYFSEPVANGRVYTVRAYDAVAEGLESVPYIMSGCQPDPPENLDFVYDQKTPPCLGHLNWDDVAGADEYRVYKNGSGTPEGTSTVSRYPASGPPLAVANDYYFEVTAYDSAGSMESDPSDSVTVDKCYAGQVDVTYWLHSNPTPPNWHGDAPPPLTMNDTPPSHSTLYNYNGSDPAKPGREIAKNGGPPPGETDPDNYLEWRSPAMSLALEFVTDADLIIWGKNPVNAFVDSVAYLYYRDEGSGAYTYVTQAGYTFDKNVTEWIEVTYTFDVDGYTVQFDPDGNRLVVWLVAPGAKELHFAYDTRTDVTPGYPSRLVFTGRW